MTQAAPVALDPVRDRRWRDFVDRHPGATIFHHPAWVELVCGHYGYGATATCLADAAGHLVAGLPLAQVESRLTGNRLVALPFSDLCPPLADAAHEEQLAQALDAERRRLALPLEIHAPARGLGDCRVTDRFWHHLLSLAGGPDAVRGRFAKSQVARGIAKAEREGVGVERHRDAGALDRFFALHAATRRRQGVPTQPRAFMRGLSALFGQGLGFVLEARLGGRVAASAVFLLHNGTLVYKYGASDRRMLGARPNNLLFMEAIRIGCTEGMHTLDLGRTDMGNEGLRAFKSAWGAEERELHYVRVADTHPSRRRPLPRAAAATLIRHAPAPVGRAIGRTLYRHFA